ncbi:MAG: ATP synthase subunit I [candidate division NC10 bacterium]|nr:ATP synthase subunit I [candidate division NC10 bacterium]
METKHVIQGTVKGTLLLGLGGTGLLLLLGREGWALGFSLGAFLGIGNFQLIAWAVLRAMGPERSNRPRYLWKGSLLRLLLVGLAFFLAFRYLHVNLFVLAFGLLFAQFMILILLVAKGAKAG